MRFGSPRQQAVLCLSFIALFAVSVGVSVGLTRMSDGIATIWTANAFLAASFLLLNRKWAAATATACFAINIVFNLLVNDGLALSVGLSAINLGEAAGVAWLAKRFCPSIPLITYVGLARLLGLAVLPIVAVSSILASSLCAFVFDKDILLVFRHWLCGNFLGMTTFLPGILLLTARSPKVQQLRDGWHETTIFLIFFALVAFAPHDGIRIAGVFLSLGVLFLRDRVALALQLAAAAAVFVFVQAIF